MGSMWGIFFDYDGSDYCADLNFGFSGANLLTNLATTLRFVSENNDEDNNTATNGLKYDESHFNKNIRPFLGKDMNKEKYD